MNGFETTPYEFPKLLGRNFLVVGLGGRCDIVSAYALAEMIKSADPEKIVYGNTKCPSSERLNVVTTCRQWNRNVLELLTGCCRARFDGFDAPSLLPFKAELAGRLTREVCAAMVQKRPQSP